MRVARGADERSLPLLPPLRLEPAAAASPAAFTHHATHHAHEPSLQPPLLLSLADLALEPRSCRSVFDETATLSLNSSAAWLGEHTPDASDEVSLRDGGRTHNDARRRLEAGRPARCIGCVTRSAELELEIVQKFNYYYCASLAVDHQ